MSQGTIKMSTDAHAAGASALYSALALVRRRLCWLSMAGAACWALVGFSLVVLMGMWFDLLWECSSDNADCRLDCGAATGLALFASQMVKMFRHAKAAALARRIDTAACTGGEILAGLELDRGQLGMVAAEPRHGAFSGWPCRTAGWRRDGKAGSQRTANSPGRQRAVGAHGGSRSDRSGVSAVIVDAMGSLYSGSPTMCRRIRPSSSACNRAMFRSDTAAVWKISSTVSGAPVDRLDLVMSFADHEDVLPMFVDSEGRGAP